MGESKIEWTDHTWNPVVGCSIVSPGCTNCYAMKMAGRIEAINLAGSTDENGYRVRPAPGSKTRDHYEGTTRKVKGKPIWTGKLALAPDHILLAPLHWKKPRRIFVNSMGDLFHEDAPDEWIDKVFAVMALCPQHQFQVLTKRAERMREYWSNIMERFDAVEAAASTILNGRNVPSFDGRESPLHNVWLGVSAERQQEANERIPHLLQTPAAIRFVSCEPLLGPIDLTEVVTREPGSESMINALQSDIDPSDDELLKGATLDWIIVGGESGPGARPMHPDWARSLREQCATAGVKFFFKQWGEYGPRHFGPADKIGTHRFVDSSVAEGEAVFRLGKKAAGRLLDGREHNEFPDARSI